jgi:hypothetical protein
MAFETELSNRISFDQPWSKGPMDFMAITAFYPALFHGMMGLFILLRPDVLVAGIAEIGFSNP